MSDKPFNNPFGALGGMKAQLPEGKAPKVAARRAVVAYERKGHGGKEATRITHFAATSDEALVLVKQLKQKLGCGGVSEGSDIILQGDQRERLRTILPSLGVQRLTIA